MTGFPSRSAEPVRPEELYQSVILDHNRRPRNYREMEGADARAEGKNPNCGDKVIVWLRLEGDTVADVSFRVPPGEGCAISRASASIMTTAVKGKRVVEVEALFDRFIKLLTVQRAAAVPTEPQPESAADLGSLEVFSGVSRFPHRVKCATMAWHALHSALREAVASAPGA
jgi:nitrogen fixation NifU-like protein